MSDAERPDQAFAGQKRLAVRKVERDPEPFVLLPPGLEAMELQQVAPGRRDEGNLELRTLRQLVHLG